MLVAIDLGNTRVKFAAFDGDRIFARESVEGGAPVESGVIPFPHVAAAEQVVVVSSAPQHLDTLLLTLERPARVLGEDVQRAVRTTYADPLTLGTDRIAAAWGAGRHAPGMPVVVVDAGTAVTVDALRQTADGPEIVAVGIAAGLRACAAGLAAAAPHLPRAETHPGPVQTPARGTADSLRTGHLLAFAGAVERLVDTAREHVGAEAAVVLTGGMADTLEEHLRADLRRVAHCDPDCVLHGVRLLHAEVPV